MVMIALGQLMEVQQNSLPKVAVLVVLKDKLMEMMVVQVVVMLMVQLVEQLVEKKLKQDKLEIVEHTDLEMMVEQVVKMEITILELVGVLVVEVRMVLF